MGRGVYASRPITSGETIEICPVILISGNFDDLPMEIRRIVFDWSVLAKTEGVHAIALGYGSMYNHANPANLRYEACGGGQFLRFTAVTPIAQEAELTVNYNAFGGYPTSDEDTWFESVEVELITRNSELPQA
ncbi:SET domain-containing protein-lysine N-methyltransferase [Pseudomonas sp.]|uniref:SET domain-containing protein-lysine N-methyltransferase n=1 Tax=Pseudomonas sp. TaxID=306 RepID=UPI003A985909